MIIEVTDLINGETEIFFSWITAVNYVKMRKQRLNKLNETRDFWIEKIK